ncbi:nuclear cap-binding protein subunit 3 isoform X1 [Hydra vulgaris]|uniref:nuclear cap-binding protein subunit 3 isoform X1 n=1 Tax=Hydra vulgaris TaxID=6087 RepID=UPI001F5F82F8|nr:nuclear cap-binding protein subunit 3 [Hydra vulgaris]
MDFENLQIEVPNISCDELPQNYGVKVYEKKYHNKASFVIGFDPNSEEAENQRKKREQRFGTKYLDSNLQSINLQNKKLTLNKLGTFDEINLENILWPSVPKDINNEIRQDAILLYGVNNMSTKDVFNYFHLYGPENLEWIDDFSCNVVWENESLVVKAIESMSKTYIMLRQLKKIAGVQNEQVVIKEEPNDEIFKDAVLVDDDEYDPKDVWRIARPYGGDQLFMRYATIRDKKLPRAAERSEYYLKYGRNSFTKKSGLGILSKSRKRKLESMKALAEQRFKDNTPDVKIIDLADLKQEGIVEKIETDYIEPVVKRLNYHSKEDSNNTNSSMVADLVEIESRGGKKLNSVKDRLGQPISENSSQKSSIGHQKKHIYERLGNRNSYAEKDARHDINFSRRKRGDIAGNDSDDDEQSRFDSNEDYEEDNIRNKDKHFEMRTSQKPDNRNRLNPNNITDLRNKIKKSSKLPSHKEQDDEKLNLFIVIKQEPEDTEMEFEF